MCTQTSPEDTEDTQASLDIKLPRTSITSTSRPKNEQKANPQKLHPFSLEEDTKYSSRRRNVTGENEDIERNRPTKESDAGRKFKWADPFKLEEDGIQTHTSTVTRSGPTMQGSAFRLQYSVLLVIQVILLILFFVFTKYTDGMHEAKGFEGTHVMIFIGFGYLMTFLKKYSYSALGFNWLLAAIVIQWAILCQNFFHMKDSVIYISKMTLLEADIMAATVLITFGALLGVASGLQLIFIAVVETAIACCNLYLVVDVLQAADAGGSIAIHTFGAYFGLGCSFAMNWRKKIEPAGEQNEKLDGPNYSSDITAMIGSIFLWIYWPAFNSALVESESEYQRAVINTYLSLASATVTTFAISSLVNHEQGKFDMVHIQNSTLAGGVAVGSVANMVVSPGGAIAIGIGAGVLSVLGYRKLTPYLTNKGILDTCGVNNLHGMPGIFSGLLSVIFAAIAQTQAYGTDLNKVFPARGTADEEPRTTGDQALYQLAAISSTVLIAIVAGIMTGMLARLKIFNPKSKHEQLYNDAEDWELPA